MQKLALVIFFQIICLQVSGQVVDSFTFEERVFDSNSRGVFDSEIGIHIMPLSLVSAQQRMRMGVMTRWYAWEYLIDIEYGNRWMRDIFFRHDPLPYSFIGIRPEVRYHYGTGKWWSTSRYAAIEMHFNSLRRDKVNHNFSDQRDSTYFYSRATQKRWRSGLMLKAGSVAKIGSHGYVDVFAGIGVALRDVKYTDVIFPSQPDDIPREHGLINPLREGMEWVLDLGFGIRFGYIIKS